MIIPEEFIFKLSEESNFFPIYLLEYDIFNNENFKKIIENEDLVIVLSILKYKLLLTHKRKLIQQEFDVIKLCKRVPDNSFLVLHDILFYSLLNQPTLDDAYDIFTKAHINISNVKDKSTILNNLEIIDVILEIFSLITSNALSCDMQDNLNKLIKNLICNDQTEIRKKIILDIIPKYIEYTKNYDIFSTIWKKINLSFEIDIIIALEKYFIPQIYNKLNFNILHEEAYWLCLQNNLCTSNSVLKKQSLFLLKKSVYTLLLNENYQNFDTILDIINLNTYKQDEYKNSWRNFFILCEVSNEKQIHLIEPTFKLYNSLNFLHFSWRDVVTKQFVFHSHSAVVKQTVLNILKGDWYCDIEAVLSGLNNNFLYEDSTILLNYLNAYICKIDNFSLFINKICSTHLSSIPLYYICRCIASADLKDVSLQNIIDLIILTETVPHLYIRKGILHTLFLCFIKICDNSENLNENLSENFIKIVSLFYNYKYLQKNNVAWQQVLELLIKKKNLYYNIEKIKEINSLCTLSRDYSVMVTLLIEAKVIDTNWIENYLQFILKTQKENKLDDFEFLLNVVSIINDKYFNDQDFKIILNEIFIICSNIETSLYTLSFFEKIEYIFDVIISKIYLNNNLSQCFVQFLDKLKNNSVCYIILSKKIIKVCKKCSENELNILLLNLKNAKRIFKNELKYYNESNIKQKIFSNYYYTKLNLKNILYERNHCFDINMLEKINKYYDKGGSDIIISVLNALNTISENISSENVPLEFIPQFLNILICCQKDIFNLRTNELFRPAITKFITVILHPQLFQFEVLQNYINAFCLNMFDSSQTITGIRNEILDRIFLTNLTPNLLVDALLFGQILRKDQRIEFETCDLISKDIKYLNLDVVNSCQFDTKIRVKAINILSTFIFTQKHDFCDSVLKLLMKKYNETAGKRYFGNSQIHVIKLRILQTLHLLISELENSAIIDLKEWLFDCLVNEGHQPSIKILIQWLLVKIYKKLNDRENIISKLISSLDNLKGTSCISIFPILYHLIKDKTVNMNVVYKCIDILLPYTMGQQFNIRFNAQITIQQIYQIYSSEPEFVEKYRIIYHTINEVINQTSKDKLNDNILTFYNLKSSVQTIFYDIPRLTNVTYTEWLPVNYFTETINIPLVSNNEISKLENVVKPSQMYFENNGINNMNVQKKIDPLALNITEDDQTKNYIGNLIVIASLIDKIPNLGGLSRTCEVFGVRQYVLNNNQFVKNKEYQSLSMSSEKWVDTIEVKIENLSDYLISMKNKNYKIVGAEQTSDSKRLDSVKFNTNTVLLLGNEKEGIPPNLLYLLDECIEIPQFGQIRSLNVHVAGALFIWEYVKQHCYTT